MSLLVHDRTTHYLTFQAWNAHVSKGKKSFTYENGNHGSEVSHEIMYILKTTTFVHKTNSYVNIMVHIIRIYLSIYLSIYRSIVVVVVVVGVVVVVVFVVVVAVVVEVRVVKLVKLVKLISLYFFDIFTSKKAQNPQFFTLLTSKCASCHNGVHFFDTFSTSEPPKVVRDRQFLTLLTWKCASRHNGVHFFDITTSKSGPTLVCFVHFDFEMCFAPRRRALFRHLNFQKWSENGVFCTF